MKKLIKDKLGIDLYIKSTRAIGGGLVLELHAIENKIELMKKKTLLKGIEIWIDDDLRERKKQIQK